MIVSIFKILGSLGLFLYGMKVMSEGIQKAAGPRLQNVLNLMTYNRFSGVLTGFSITALIQSSSATTVMVVGFVNAGILTLVQAIGVIMGANIGTTVTGWIVAVFGFKFSITSFALPAIALGIFFFLIKRLKRTSWGEVLLGFGMLFLGLSMLKDSMPDIKNNPTALAFLTNLSGRGFLSYLAFIGAGTVITIIAQSSSAMMAITQTLAFSGWIDFPTAAALILGENIGTTITAFLASLGTNVHARRASRVHTLFNVFGVIWMSFVFKFFLILIDIIVPGGGVLKENLPTRLALFHTLFNVANTLLLIWFVPQLGKLVEIIVHPKKGEKEERYRLKYISSAMQQTPEINLLKAQNEIITMFDIVADMFGRFRRIFSNTGKQYEMEVEEVKKLEEYTDDMQEEISQYLVDCSKENLTDASSNNINVFIRVIDELENIGDSCYTLAVLAERRNAKKIRLEEQALLDVEPYADLVREFLEFLRKRLNKQMSPEDYELASDFEKRINEFRDNLKKGSRKRIKAGAPVKSELLYIDFLKHLEHIGDFSLSISKVLMQIM
ncbi:MAG: Na/Pi cotransporter family protein [Spirochaetales bacterium]|nr:MAG: Na/Pi cotransporter family protein [Spirochaetales bacterium]